MKDDDTPTPPQSELEKIQQELADLKEQAHNAELERSQTRRATGQLFFNVLLLTFGLIPAIFIFSSEHELSIPAGGGKFHYRQPALITPELINTVVKGISGTALTTGIAYLGLWVVGRKDMADDWLAKQAGAKPKQDEED